MFNVFTEEEKKVATLLIQKGLHRASSSLTTIFNSSVKIDELDFTILSILKGVHEFRLSTSKNFYVLKSELIGDIQGTNILILNQSDVSKIVQVCLPNGTELGEGIDQNTMTEELLKEIDNIISAAVTSEFANDMGINLHGNVPELYYLSTKELKSFVTKQFSSRDYIINFKTHLSVLDLDISPDFIWILDKEFIREVKKMRGFNLKKKLDEAV